MEDDGAADADRVGDLMAIPLVYIAGPFRGQTPYEVHANVCAAEALGLAVARLGGYPIIPHTMTQHFDKLLTDQFWLEGTMELLRRCDALVARPNWRQSTGATAEVEYMLQAPRPVFFAYPVDPWEDNLLSWIHAWKANQERKAFIV